MQLTWAVLGWLLWAGCCREHGAAAEEDGQPRCPCLASHHGSKATSWAQLWTSELNIMTDAVLNISNQCLLFQNDIYQRFSGYVAKHRMAKICSSTLDMFERLRHVVMGTWSCPCVDVRNVPTTLEYFLTSLKGLSVELKRMMQDTNSYGDGSFHEILVHHFNEIAQHVLELHSEEKFGETMWDAELRIVVDNLLQLLTATIEEVQEGITYHMVNYRIQDVSSFLRSLEDFPATVRVRVSRPPAADPYGMCRDVFPVYKSQQVYDQLADPRAWKGTDVSGMLALHPPLSKIIFKLASALPLSYGFVCVAPRALVGTQELTAEYKLMFSGTGGRSAPAAAAAASSGAAMKSSCTGTGFAYNPALCLFDLGWGSMTFSLGTEPPLDGVLSVQWMSLRAERPLPFVQPVANGTHSMEDLFTHVDHVYKSLNTPSPDMLFLSPMVGNCLTLLQLGPSRRGVSAGQAPHINPKLIVMPINPLIPPPVRLAPNFTEWYGSWLSMSAEEQEQSDGSEWWFAQCSLASADLIMRGQGYRLLHVEHTFAVFILKGLWPAVRPLLQKQPNRFKMEEPHAELAMTPHELWLEGWYCSPLAPTLFGLEVKSGIDLTRLYKPTRMSGLELDEVSKEVCLFARWHGMPLDKGHSLTCSSEEGAVPLAQASSGHHFWRVWHTQDVLEEPGKAYMLATTGHGRCLRDLGFCECFPPYRGSFCEIAEPGMHDAERSYRGVLHYLVGERERLLADFVKTLPLLWDNFNHKFDYPVVVFHDGLSATSRRRILEASPNRIWFAFVEDYAAVPSVLKDRLELDLGGYNLGYRGMCRFRSGPMFTHPVMSGFDYAWTLDTDGYFPAPINFDPIERMWRGDHVYAYSHISRDQASAVQHFWEFCRLYMSIKGLDPKSTQMMRRITDALVLRDTFWHEWNRVLFMNDIEIVQLSWFRGKQYQDFFQFLDSVGGFWLYRWGDHAVRTIAIALFVEPSKLMRMGVPYAHQETCRCGEEHPDQVCARKSEMDWWYCEPSREGSSAQIGAGPAASWDIGTIDESLIFGGV